MPPVKLCVSHVCSRLSPLGIRCVLFSTNSELDVIDVIAGMLQRRWSGGCGSGARKASVSQRRLNVWNKRHDNKGVALRLEHEEQRVARGGRGVVDLTDNDDDTAMLSYLRDSTQARGLTNDKLAPFCSVSGQPLECLHRLQMSPSTYQTNPGHYILGHVERLDQCESQGNQFNPSTASSRSEE